MKKMVIKIVTYLLIFFIACIIVIVCHLIWTLNYRLPDEFRNLPEGEDIIDKSQYEYISNEWILSGTPSRRAKGSKTIYLYNNDPNAIFFANQPQFDDAAGTSYYHKKNDIFPKPYDETATIVLVTDSKDDIMVEKELGIEFKEFIKEFLVDSKNVILLNSKIEYTKAKIKIYHKNYPAYHNFASIDVLSEKLVMLSNSDSQKMIYYELPDSLSEQINSLIEK